MKVMFIKAFINYRESLWLHQSCKRRKENGKMWRNFGKRVAGKVP